MLARAARTGLTHSEDPGATLVIDSDSCWCSACGGGAAIEEREYLTLLAREVAGGWAVPPEGQRAGCGSTFTATATEHLAPMVVEHIREVRPDLPFLGMHGVEAQA